MCECLREVSQVLSAAAELLGVETKMVCVAKHLVEEQARFFQLIRACEALDEPERARGEAAFPSLQSVDGIAFCVVTVDEAVFSQRLFDRIHGGEPAWIDGADEAHERHQER